MLRKLMTMVATIAIVLGASVPAMADTTTLKLGTLAPAESPWGKVFKVWQKGINERTSGAVAIQFFWNGQQGDETAMVGKIRTGQLDGAAITAVGLGQIYKQVLVLQLPGLFSSWEKLDAARDAMKPLLDAQYEQNGFKNLGSGDVGAAHMMCRGFQIHSPKDMKKRGTFYLKGDPIAPMLYSIIGDITPKEVSVPEITTGLTSGTLNVVNAPPLVAEQLQWAPQLDNIDTMVSGYGIGALVFSSAKYKSLPADVQTAIQETGALAATALTKSIRNADLAAYNRLAVGNPGATPPVPARMTTYSHTDAEKAEWTKLFADTRNKLKSATFNKLLVEALENGTPIPATL